MIEPCSRLVLVLLILSVACTPFPRWIHVAETRLEAPSATNGFSPDLLQRAQVVAAGVASEIGMKPGEEMFGSIEPDQMRSSFKKPPRRLLGIWAGRQQFGLSITLEVEISEDGKTLYLSVTDPEHGSATRIVEHITKLLRARVEAEFPGETVVHEAKSVGPIFSLPP